MRRETKTKLIFIFTAAFLTTAAVFSQSMMQQDPTRDLERQAEAAAQKWEKELSLTAKQYDLMKRKLIEFAIKKDQLLQSKMRQEAKTERLMALKALEIKDMRDILTKPQYDRYISLLRQEAQRLQMKS